MLARSEGSRKEDWRKGGTFVSYIEGKVNETRGEREIETGVLE